MKAAVVSLYNAGTAAGASSGHHTTTYTMTSSEKTKDLGSAHNYRYINANNVYNAGSNSAHQTTTYTAGTKASAAASTYDMGASNKYRYINATAAWNKAYTDGQSNPTPSAVQADGIIAMLWWAWNTTSQYANKLIPTGMSYYGGTSGVRTKSLTSGTYSYFGIASHNANNSAQVQVYNVTNSSEIDNQGPTNPETAVGICGTFKLTKTCSIRVTAYAYCGYAMCAVWRAK